ncbi:MAG: hypothetical protein WC877_00205 [Dehalococcoidales bacterium]|jgi:hypothetical protein
MSAPYTDPYKNYTKKIVDFLKDSGFPNTRDLIRKLGDANPEELEWLIHASPIGNTAKTGSPLGKTDYENTRRAFTKMHTENALAEAKVKKAVEKHGVEAVKRAGYNARIRQFTSKNKQYEDVLSDPSMGNIHPSTSQNKSHTMYERAAQKLNTVSTAAHTIGKLINTTRYEKKMINEARKNLPPGFVESATHLQGVAKSQTEYLKQISGLVESRAKATPVIPAGVIRKQRARESSERAMHTVTTMAAVKEAETTAILSAMQRGMGSVTHKNRAANRQPFGNLSNINGASLAAVLPMARPSKPYTQKLIKKPTVNDGFSGTMGSSQLNAIIKAYNKPSKQNAPIIPSTPVKSFKSSPSIFSRAKSFVKTHGFDIATAVGGTAGLLGIGSMVGSIPMFARGGSINNQVAIAEAKKNLFAKVYANPGLGIHYAAPVNRIRSYATSPDPNVDRSHYDPTTNMINLVGNVDSRTVEHEMVHQSIAPGMIDEFSEKAGGVQNLRNIFNKTLPQYAKDTQNELFAKGYDPDTVAYHGLNEMLAQSISTPGIEDINKSKEWAESFIEREGDWQYKGSHEQRVKKLLKLRGQLKENFGFARGGVPGMGAQVRAFYNRDVRHMGHMVRDDMFRRQSVDPFQQLANPGQSAFSSTVDQGQSMSSIPGTDSFDLTGLSGWFDRLYHPDRYGGFALGGELETAIGLNNNKSYIYPHNPHKSFQDLSAEVNGPKSEAYLRYMLQSRKFAKGGRLDTSPLFRNNSMFYRKQNTEYNNYRKKYSHILSRNELTSRGDFSKLRNKLLKQVKIFNKPLFGIGNSPSFSNPFASSGATSYKSESRNLSNGVTALAGVLSNSNRIKFNYDFTPIGVRHQNEKTSSYNPNEDYVNITPLQNNRYREAFLHEMFHARVERNLLGDHKDFEFMRDRIPYYYKTMKDELTPYGKSTYKQFSPTQRSYYTTTYKNNHLVSKDDQEVYAQRRGIAETLAQSFESGLLGGSTPGERSKLGSKFSNYMSPHFGESSERSSILKASNLRNNIHRIFFAKGGIPGYAKGTPYGEIPNDLIRVSDEELGLTKSQVNKMGGIGILEPIRQMANSGKSILPLLGGVGSSGAYEFETTGSPTSDELPVRTSMGDTNPSNDIAYIMSYKMRKALEGSGKIGARRSIGGSIPGFMQGGIPGYARGTSRYDFGLSGLRKHRQTGLGSSSRYGRFPVRPDLVAALNSPVMRRSFEKPLPASVIEDPTRSMGFYEPTRYMRDEMGMDVREAYRMERALRNASRGKKNPFGSVSIDKLRNIDTLESPKISDFLRKDITEGSLQDPYSLMRKFQTAQGVKNFRESGLSRYNMGNKPTTIPSSDITHDISTMGTAIKRVTSSFVNLDKESAKIIRRSQRGDSIGMINPSMVLPGERRSWGGPDIGNYPSESLLGAKESTVKIPHSGMSAVPYLGGYNEPEGNSPFIKFNQLMENIKRQQRELLKLQPKFAADLSNMYKFIPDDRRTQLTTREFPNYGLPTEGLTHGVTLPEPEVMIQQRQRIQRSKRSPFTQAAINAVQAQPWGGAVENMGMLMPEDRPLAPFPPGKKGTHPSRLLNWQQSITDIQQSKRAFANISSNLYKGVLGKYGKDTQFEGQDKFSKLMEPVSGFLETPQGKIIKDMMDVPQRFVTEDFGTFNERRGQNVSPQILQKFKYIQGALRSGLEQPIKGTKTYREQISGEYERRVTDAEDEARIEISNIHRARREKQDTHKKNYLAGAKQSSHNERMRSLYGSDWRFELDPSMKTGSTTYSYANRPLYEMGAERTREGYVGGNKIIAGIKNIAPLRAMRRVVRGSDMSGAYEKFMTKFLNEQMDEIVSTTGQTTMDVSYGQLHPGATSSTVSPEEQINTVRENIARRQGGIKTAMESFLQTELGDVNASKYLKLDFADIIDYETEDGLKAARSNITVGFAGMREEIKKQYGKTDEEITGLQDKFEETFNVDIGRHGAGAKQATFTRGTEQVKGGGLQATTPMKISKLSKDFSWKAASISMSSMGVYFSLMGVFMQLQGALSGVMASLSDLNGMFKNVAYVQAFGGGLSKVNEIMGQAGTSQKDMVTAWKNAQGVQATFALGMTSLATAMFKDREFTDALSSSIRGLFKDLTNSDTLKTFKELLKAGAAALPAMVEGLKLFVGVLTFFKDKGWLEPLVKWAAYLMVATMLIQPLTSGLSLFLAVAGTAAELTAVFGGVTAGLAAMGVAALWLVGIGIALAAAWEVAARAIEFFTNGQTKILKPSDIIGGAYGALTGVKGYVGGGVIPKPAYDMVPGSPDDTVAALQSGETVIPRGGLKGYYTGTGQTLPSFMGITNNEIKRSNDNLQFTKTLRTLDEGNVTTRKEYDIFARADDGDGIGVYVRNWVTGFGNGGKEGEGGFPFDIGIIDRLLNALSFTPTPISGGPITTPTGLPVAATPSPFSVVPGNFPMVPEEETPISATSTASPLAANPLASTPIAVPNPNSVISIIKTVIANMAQSISGAWGNFVIKVGDATEFVHKGILDSFNIIYTTAGKIKEGAGNLAIALTSGGLVEAIKNTGTTLVKSAGSAIISANSNIGRSIGISGLGRGATIQDIYYHHAGYRELQDIKDYGPTGRSNTDYATRWREGKYTYAPGPSPIDVTRSAPITKSFNEFEKEFGKALSSFAQKNRQLILSDPDNYVENEAEGLLLEQRLKQKSLGLNVDAHGILKGDPLKSLDYFLTQGIDKSRKFHTAPLTDLSPGSGYLGAAGGAYKTGPFTLMSKPGQSLVDKTGKLDIGAVLVNKEQELAIQTLRDQYKDINFVTHDQVEDYLKGSLDLTQTHTPSKLSVNKPRFGGNLKQIWTPREVWGSDVPYDYGSTARKAITSGGNPYEVALDIAKVRGQNAAVGYGGRGFQWGGQKLAPVIEKGLGWLSGKTGLKIGVEAAEAAGKSAAGRKFLLSGLSKTSAILGTGFTKANMLAGNPAVFAGAHFLESRQASKEFRSGRPLNDMMSDNGKYNTFTGLLTGGFSTAGYAKGMKRWGETFGKSEEEMRDLMNQNKDLFEAGPSIGAMLRTGSKTTDKLLGTDFSQTLEDVGDTFEKGNQSLRDSIVSTNLKVGLGPLGEANVSEGVGDLVMGLNNAAANLANFDIEGIFGAGTSLIGLGEAGMELAGNTANEIGKNPIAAADLYMTAGMPGVPIPGMSFLGPYLASILMPKTTNYLANQTYGEGEYDGMGQMQTLVDSQQAMADNVKTMTDALTTNQEATIESLNNTNWAYAGKFNEAEYTPSFMKEPQSVSALNEAISNEVNTQISQKESTPQQMEIVISVSGSDKNEIATEVIRRLQSESIIEGIIRKTYTR